MREGEGGALGGLLDQAKGFFDQHGDGKPLDDVADMARGLFNRDQVLNPDHRAARR